MAEVERQGVTLRLTQQEAEDLHGVLWAHITGAASIELINIHAGLADQNIPATKFDAHYREGGPPYTVVLRERIGSVTF